MIGSVVPAEQKPETDASIQPAALSYGDREPDGKRSLGGSGEMIEFMRPEGQGRLSGIKVHGSGYGLPDAPDEKFLVYILSEDQSEVIGTQMAPYSLFERGPERWVEVTFQRPIEVSSRFWIVLDFRPHQTKGVYVSYDTSTSGKHSQIGLPGIKPRQVNFGGDWLIEALLAK